MPFSTSKQRNLSTQQNTRYSATAATSHYTTSGTPTQVTRVTKEDESTTNYSSLGLTYDSRRSDFRNQVLISEKHTFAGTQCHVERSGVVSTEDSVFPGQLIEHGHYAHLQH